MTQILFPEIPSFLRDQNTVEIPVEDPLLAQQIVQEAITQLILADTKFLAVKWCPLDTSLPPAVLPLHNCSVDPSLFIDEHETVPSHPHKSSALWQLFRLQRSEYLPFLSPAETFVSSPLFTGNALVHAIPDTLNLSIYFDTSKNTHFVEILHVCRESYRCKPDSSTYWIDDIDVFRVPNPDLFRAPSFGFNVYPLIQRFKTLVN